MDAPSLRVLQPGLMTTVQGLGHAGLQRFGVPSGGAMDPASLRIANALVRNPADLGAVEICLTGPVLEALSDALLAVAGAEMSIAVDGSPVRNWRAFRVPAGSLLTFGRRRSGAYAYLAAAGGLRRAGGDAGDRMAKEEVLVREWPSISDLPLLELPPSERPDFTGSSTLRVIVGPQWERFSPGGRAALLSGEFAVTPESNRVGIRLSGAALEFDSGQSAGIVSEPAPLGTVQVPASGQPIVLMVDRPVTGGYSKIATVISADIPRAAQLAPGETVRFRRVDLAEANAAAVELETRLRLMERVSTWNTG